MCSWLDDVQVLLLAVFFIVVTAPMFAYVVDHNWRRR